MKLFGLDLVVPAITTWLVLAGVIPPALGYPFFMSCFADDSHRQAFNICEVSVEHVANFSRLQRRNDQVSLFILGLAYEFNAFLFRIRLESGLSSHKRILASISDAVKMRFGYGTSAVLQEMILPEGIDD